MSTQKSISGIIGKGSIRHNNRDFYAANVDQDRTKNNIILKKQNIREAYHELFDDALEEYNAKQKRRDRRIPDYYEHIRTSKQEKLFYEVIFQIGDMNDTPAGTPEGDRAALILSEFYNKFAKDNPHIHIFNAVIHMDEATPHLHIDFIPVATENKRGLSTKNSLSKALEQQGFKSEGKLNTCSKLWIDSEKQRLAECMAEHGIEHEVKGIHRSNLSVEEFKLQQRMKEVAELEEKIAEKSGQLVGLDDKIDSRQSELEALTDKKKKVKSLDKIQTGKTLIKGNVTLSPEDYDSLVTHAKKYYTRKNRENELTSQVKDLKRENTALKNTVSEQRSEISRLQSIRERLNIHKLQKELADVKSLLDKVMRFIDIMGLRERLEQFLSQSKTRIKNIEK